MRGRSLLLTSFLLLAVLAFLGAGCGKARPPVAPLVPVPAAPSTPSPDPLADDLDQAIEDLKAIER